VNETRNAEKVRELLKNNKEIKIPKNYLHLCNNKVIVMEYVDGISLINIEYLKEKGFNLK